MSPPDPTLAARIDSAIGGLSPLERRVADFLRARPDESAFYNSSELARRTGVSKATVSRLYRRLGFTRSAEARDLLRAERATGVPVVLPSGEDPVSRQLEQDRSNLERAYADLDRDGLLAAAAAIAAARRVLVVGLRSGAPLALHLRQALAQARADVSLAPLPGQTLAEELTGLGPGDVLVVIAPRRRPAVTGALLGGAAVQRVPVLLITDDEDAGIGDWTLRVPVAASSAFDSLAAAASVTSLLAGEVLRASGAGGAARVRAIADRYERMAELA